MAMHEAQVVERAQLGIQDGLAQGVGGALIRGSESVVTVVGVTPFPVLGKTGDRAGLQNQLAFPRRMPLATRNCWTKGMWEGQT